MVPPQTFNALIQAIDHDPDTCPSQLFLIYVKMQTGKLVPAPEANLMAIDVQTLATKAVTYTPDLTFDDVSAIVGPLMDWSHVVVVGASPETTQSLPTQGFGDISLPDDFIWHHLKEANQGTGACFNRHGYREILDVASPSQPLH